MGFVGRQRGRGHDPHGEGQAPNLLRRRLNPPKTYSKRHCALVAALVLGLLVPIVVRGAKRLPIGLRPHQDRVTLMGLDVVDYGCPRYPAAVLAHDAERMLSKECEAFTLPTSAVSARCSLGSVVLQWG